MFRWIPYTFVRTVLFFIAGILLGLYVPDLMGERLSFVFVTIFTTLYFLLVFLGPRLRHIFNPGLLALPVVFLLGYLHLIRQTESRNPDHLFNNDEPISYYKAIITRFADEKARSWKIEARVLAINTGGWESKGGKVILYFSKKDFPEPFIYGDVLLIKGSPQKPQPPGNPGEFDYRRFLTAKNIFHQHYLIGEEVIKINHSPPNKVMAFAIRGREWAENTLNEFVNGEREQAIASALVLGVTDGLDNDLLNAYSATGSMHVLAVSGLHISIIYFIILWILKPLNKLPGGQWIIAAISLLILWMYAFITGLSPSVLRAVTMFSFLAVAKPWSRRTNVYNTLAVSAFCLLLFDPFLLLSVGFQLSYLAVLGIVYLYPRFLSLWEPAHWLLTEIWKIICLSIAAQIATFSLGLLYFHQFPNYFLLSNLLVVPISFGILILGLLLLGVSFASFLATVVGFCLEMIIRLLNYIVFAIESFPFNLIDNVYISGLQCCLIFSLILVFIALAENRKFKYIVMASVIIFLYVSVQWLHFSRDVNIQKFTVYKIPGHTAIDFIDHGQTFFQTDSVLRSDLQKIRFHIRPNRLISGVKKVNLSQPHSRSFRGCNLIVWQGKTILQITDSDYEVPGHLNLDWVIIGNNAVWQMDKIVRNITFKTLILDSSNSYSFATHFLEEAKLFKFDVHSVLHKGAFDLKIDKQDS